MGEEINKEFEEFQKSIEIHNKNLKPKVIFEPDDALDEMINDIKNKNVVL